jgi:hypothetical protein
MIEMTEKSTNAIFHPETNLMPGICDVVMVMSARFFDMTLTFSMHPNA